jgi:hypothetical protein
MEFMASNGRSAVGRKRAYCLALLTRSRIKMITAFHYSSLCFAVLSNYVYFNSALLREALLNLKLPRQMSSTSANFLFPLFIPSLVHPLQTSISQYPSCLKSSESTIRNPHNRHTSRSANPALAIRQLGSSRTSGHDVHFSVADALEVLSLVSLTYLIILGRGW